jgi:hypothetical protein
MDDQENRWIRDVRELKALTHPLRVRLYYALLAEEAATATRLAELVSESPALVSYHLQQLATYGFIVEAPELVRDHRERWWKPSSRGFTWSQNDFGATPEQRAVATTAKRLLVANQFDRLRQFEEEQPAWGPEWTSASFSIDNLLRLTAAQTAELQRELQELLERWRTAGQAADRTDPDHGAGREHVMVIAHGFPFRP